MSDSFVKSCVVKEKQNDENWSNIAFLEWGEIYYVSIN